MQNIKYNRSLKGSLLLLAMILFTGAVKGQVQQALSLEQALGLANKESLDAFRAKNRYAIDYWEFKAYKARLLPRVDFTTSPFTYNRSFIKRYDDENNIDVYRLQQNLNSFAELSISQNIRLTGATVYARSSFNRLVSYGNQTIENFNTNPILLGINQPIMAYNPLKWERETAALEFEKAKKEYIFQEQEINLKTVSLFFNWALKNTRLEIARENVENTSRLYEIGKKRYDLGSIEKDDLLNLELESFTAVTRLTQAEQELQAVMFDLKIFLNVEELFDFQPKLPEVISNVKIDLDQAVALAKDNNPDLLDAAIDKINAERDLDRVMKNNRFDFSINARYGLNQQANEFANAYTNFLDQQMVAVNFSIPLLDWGERKGNIQIARMARETAAIEIEQLQNDINRQILLAVNNFNLQHEQVIAALRAKNISSESYEITEKRFLSGNVDLLRLLNAREAWQRSAEQYVQSLQSYWRYYHEVQQLTLYDFFNEIPLEQDFEILLHD